MQERELGDDIRKDKKILQLLRTLHRSHLENVGKLLPHCSMMMLMMIFHLVSYILSRMVFLFFSKENFMGNPWKVETSLHFVDGT